MVNIEIVDFQTIDIDGPIVITPNVFGDHRGYFFESYNVAAFEQAGIPTDFVQDNQSMSNKGVLRGMHFQNPPHAQGKLVRVITGAVQDIIVDIRKGSKTYGQSFSITLSEENKKMLWVPPGFAHGFCTLKNNTIFSYKCTELYSPESEAGLPYNDVDLNLNWELADVILSEKDLKFGAFKDFNSPF